MHNTTTGNNAVLAGQIVSNMIPAYSNNRVILGHDSSQVDFGLKLRESMAFFNGMMSIRDVPAFLRAYHIGYIIWGIDAPAFASSPYKDLPIFKAVYAQNGVSVVRVVQ